MLNTPLSGRQCVTALLSWDTSCTGQMLPLGCAHVSTPHAAGYVSEKASQPSRTLVFTTCSCSDEKPERTQTGNKNRDTPKQVKTIPNPALGPQASQTTVPRCLHGCLPSHTQPCFTSSPATVHQVQSFLGPKREAFREFSHRGSRILIPGFCWSPESFSLRSYVMLGYDHM